MTAVSPEAIERWKAAKRKASREAKRKRTGRCLVCGGPTRYSGHTPAVSERCLSCANAATQKAKRGTGKTELRALEALREHGEMRFLELASALEISNGHATNLLHRLRVHGFIERPRRGVYRLPQ